MIKRKLKEVIKCIIQFTHDTVGFICFLLKLIYSRSFSNPLKEKYSGTLAVLANGPSLKNILPLLTTDKEFENTDFIVVNFFAFDDVFFRIKPKHYCVADPIFIKDSHKRENVLRFFKILQNEVNWDLNIYVPGKYFLKEFLSYSQLSNKYLHYIPLNSVEYTGYNSFRHFFYKKGLSMPRPQNISIMAIYVGLNMNYSIIRLYGVDHSFFNSLCVNEYNQICHRNQHFYEKTTVELKPIIDDGILWKVADYFMAMHHIFKNHDLTNNYAKFLNVKIINCTKDSMIDSYERNPC
jgi:hypothetical protein